MVSDKIAHVLLPFLPVVQIIGRHDPLNHHPVDGAVLKFRYLVASHILKKRHIADGLHQHRVLFPQPGDALLAYGHGLAFVVPGNVVRDILTRTV